MDFMAESVIPFESPGWGSRHDNSDKRRMFKTQADSAGARLHQVGILQPFDSIILPVEADPRILSAAKFQ